MRLMVIVDIGLSFTFYSIYTCSICSSTLPKLFTQQPFIQVFDKVSVDEEESHEPGDGPTEVFGSGNGEAPGKLKDGCGIT